MFKATIAALTSLALLAIAGCCHGPGKRAVDFRSVAIQEVARAQAGFTGARIEVIGLLANTGANYFTDLRLALDDATGNSIGVQCWLPLEVPPPRINAGARPRPAVVSDYLGKRVRLRGTWQKNEAGYLLQVEEATIIEEGK